MSLAPTANRAVEDGPEAWQADEICKDGEEGAVPGRKAAHCVWAGWARSNIINLSSRQNDFSSNEGVHIFRANRNHGPHLSFLCSPRGGHPVKITHTSLDRSLGRLYRVGASFAHTMLVLALALTAVGALAQQPQTIDQIRVIGNRRIPKETILARLFTHVGDTYDPISIERDFNSLWNTGYFENLRIEREDSEKGIILNVFVQEKPTIREINYKG